MHFLTRAPSSVHDKNNLKSKFKARSLWHLGVEVLAYFQCQKEEKHIRAYILQLSVNQASSDILGSPLCLLICASLNHLLALKINAINETNKNKFIYWQAG